MTVFIEDSFDAAHWLPNVPADHKCHALHGHTYRIRLEVAGDVDSQMGWVIDYAELKVQWNAVKRLVDHHCLNEIPALENSTCERLALWIAECLKPAAPGLCRIEIRETEKAGVVLEL